MQGDSWEDIWNPEPPPPQDAPPPPNPNWWLDAVHESTPPDLSGRGGGGGGGGMSEADGRAYDQAHGLVGGYMGPNGWVSGEPRSAGGVGGSDSRPNPGSVGSMVQSAPGFNAPRYKSPGAFSNYWSAPEAFHAPDRAALTQDQGFITRLELGEKALKNAASATGAGKSGAFYKGLIDYNQTMGSQEYDRFYDRSANEYDRTYRNAFEDAVTGYSFLVDDADRQFRNDLAATSAEYAPSMETWRAQTGRDWDSILLGFDKEKLGYDNAFRNNSLAAQIMQTILNAGRPG